MRNLQDSDISLLKDNGCRSGNWADISVCDNFDPNWCHYVKFSGKCTIGDLSGTRTDQYGVEIPNGIYSATIHNSTIGNGVCIDHIHNCLSNYDVADGVMISNVDVVAMKGKSSFGVGVRASVLNETGGVEVPISRNLNAQVAYMMTLMGHQDQALRAALINLIDEEAEKISSQRGTIEANAVIRNVGAIINTFVGTSTVIEGATVLENCSLCSSEEHPVYIGYNVQGKDFIASLGAKIGGGSIVERCFVGQSCHVNHLFSAHDSLLFANCNLENGEACAVFAGPFTVSCHKSSLLIAGHFSFLNAGSGSNQSNHLYKLGPIHQGVVERGSKTSSDSYILWPSRIGAFTLVMGRHVHNVDTTDFPFSYLIENDNKSYLFPGRNLLSIGTMRDAKKWPSRDKRPKTSRLDCINYNMLSPFTVGKMVCAYKTLQSLEHNLGIHDYVYVYNSLFIKATSLRKGIEIYRWGIEKYLGSKLIQRLEQKFGNAQITSETSLQEALAPDHNNGRGEWIDMSGMLAPLQGINEINADIKSGKIDSLLLVNDAIRTIHQEYYDLEWDWSYDLLCRWYGIDNEHPITADIVKVIINNWLIAVKSIDQAFLKDAHKEYNVIARVNFGIQQEDNGTYSDRVEQQYQENTIVQSVRDHIERKAVVSANILSQLSSLLS